MARRRLLARWRRARALIHQGQRRAAKLAARDRCLTEEAEALEASSLALWSALRDTRGVITSAAVGRLPWVEAGGELLPRIYVCARDFKLATLFSQEEFQKHLAVAQTGAPLSINEIWLIKPMLELLTLERIGAAAERFCRDAHGEPPALSLREEPVRGAQSLAGLTAALKSIGDADWLALFEQTSAAEKILRRDPVYSRMDPETRDRYRKAVVELAAHSEAAEIEAASLAVELAREAVAVPGEPARILERRRHAGYYLVAEGRALLEARIQYRAPFHERIDRALRRWPEFFYIIGIEVVTVGIIVFLLSGLNVALWPLAAVLLLLLPATESAVRIVNQAVTFALKPERLPKLDFSAGIPPGAATMVVVPTLLLNPDQVEEAVTGLEVRCLANPDPRLSFALLTDSPDLGRPPDARNGPGTNDSPDALAELCARRITELNQKYAGRPFGSFYMFHRHPVFNAAEGAWMGWERKRGKLLDLNRLLLGGPDYFPVKAGDMSRLGRRGEESGPEQIRYVITLDSDTSLPREAAAKLIGAMAHPLNKAVIDPASNIVVQGYGILQPRVGISVSSSTSSRLANMLSGQTGFDPYSRAISDVYQDLFRAGSFTGKGIYEVEVYQRVLAERFPPNALLSHDLIEGSYARAGLASDIEVIDDYPSHFSAYSRRKHRWVRGDWQILRWLLPRVPGNDGKDGINPISLISRWKILDNLRRSLIEATLLALLVCGWFFLPGGAVYWTVATLVLLLLPSYFQIFFQLIAASGSENWPGVLKEAFLGFASEQAAVLFTLVFLMHQALMTLDAILRTLVRVFVTHKKMLEWETAAQAEMALKKRTLVDVCLDWTPWLSLALGVAMAWFRPRALPAALPLLVAWVFSKAIAGWVNRGTPVERSVVTPRDERLLRESALRSWRYFREWSGPRINFLIPDNVQESPLLTADILSPTNLGMLLTARVAALDLGFLSIMEFARQTEASLDAVQRMPKFKGHLYNWTRIETLAAVEPLFVSTVDSGNLAASLWTVKQACLDALDRPVLSRALCRGVRDVAELLRGMLPAGEPSAAVNRFRRRLEAMRDDPYEWIGHLFQLAEMASEVERSVAQGNVEALWWAAELRERIVAFQAVAEAFAPWLLPRHEKLCRSIGVTPAAANVIPLRKLPEMMRDLRRQSMTEESTANAAAGAGADMPGFLPVLDASIAAVEDLIQLLQKLSTISDALVDAMEFGFLYNAHRKLLSVGYHCAQGRIDRSCYDLLASEARTASFIAIAKGDIRQDSWFHLGRAHVNCLGQRTLLSWSGTMFEYLMPALWMKTYPDTVLGHSQKAAVRCQQRFGEKQRRPWGVSEAGWSHKDEAGRYQYRAFGVPGLALAPGIPSRVVAPYASFLALEVDPAAAVRNLARMKKMGWIGAYGFYESADYRRGRKGRGKPEYELVRQWMAHHQGMTLLALCNLLADGAIQRRFEAEPRFRATELILHERILEVALDAPRPAPQPTREPAEIAAAAAR